MDNLANIAHAAASLMKWYCRDADHLRELISTWQHADLLSDEDKEFVVRLVVVWPEAGSLGAPRPSGNAVQV